MKKMSPISGSTLTLRLIDFADAAYIHRLRGDPALNRHLSPVQGTVADQERWIAAYKTREAAGGEFYYVIERRDNGEACGLVRLYNIADGAFTWGSWMLDSNKPPKAAFESAYLVYVIAFEQLGIAGARFDVRKENRNTLAFHRRFGAAQTHADDRDVFFVYTAEKFAADRPLHSAVLAGL
jgi:RimJ/RimL family protein N-acetyltransferase